MEPKINGQSASMRLHIHNNPFVTSFVLLIYRGNYEIDYLHNLLDTLKFIHLSLIVENGTIASRLPVSCSLTLFFKCVCWAAVSEVI